MSQKTRILLSSIFFVILVYLIIIWVNNLLEPEDYTLGEKISLGYFITLLSIPLGYLLGKGRSRKTQFIIWGIAILIPISSPLSYSIGFSYAVYSGNGFAALLMLYVFPIFSFIGTILLLIGIFKRRSNDTALN